MLRQDPSLARSAFEETIRWESPVQTFFRTTTREVEVANKRIPEGEKVLLFLGAANRDPRRWINPDTLGATQAPGDWATPTNHGFGVSKSSKNPELAFALVKFRQSLQCRIECDQVRTFFFGEDKSFI